MSVQNIAPGTQTTGPCCTSKNDTDKSKKEKDSDINVLTNCKLT